MKHAFYHGMHLDLFEDVYEPAEDSALLAKVIAQQKGSSALDVGCGAGLQTLLLAMKFNSVTSVDINPSAVKNTKQNLQKNGLKAKVFESDLFEKVYGKFDLIVFNAPYLPSLPGEPKHEAQALSGGAKGFETIKRFLGKARAYLTPHGKILIVYSSLSPRQDVEDVFDKLKYNWRVVEAKHLSFEDIIVAEAQ